VALLLADPTAVELWPRLTRAHEAPLAPGVLSIEVGSAAGELRVLPPSRTPTAFILRFDFDAGAPAESEPLRVEGRLELSAQQAGEAPATDAILELRTSRDLRADAAEFLARVAAAAENRSHAA
jgi:hypothetical protein